MKMHTLKVLICSLAATVSLYSTTASSNINSELTTMFGSMVNTTAPTAAVTGSSRGVLYGGSFTMRNKVSNPNLISFVPPSFEAGCGGINAFGGSFSFINKEQFQQLLRNVASNALGYAFNIAIDAMCEDCGEKMRELQRRIQQFNDLFSNSCQMAKGFVDGGVEAMTNKDKNFMDTFMTSSGIGNIFDYSTKTDGSDARAEAKAMTASGTKVTKDCQYDANLLWCLMIKNDTKTWFASNDTDVLQAIMSITGSYIVGPEANTEDGLGTQPTLTHLPPIATARSLLYGGDMPSYVCADGTGQNECLAPTEGTITIDQGFVTQVTEALTGPGGIIEKFRSNSAGDLSPQMQNMLANMRGGIGGLLRNLAPLGGGYAEAFADQAAPFIALEFLIMMTDEIEKTVGIATANSDHESAFAGQLHTVLAEGRTRISAERRELVTEHGRLSDNIEFYRNIMAVARHKHYGEIINGGSAGRTGTTN